MGQPRRSFVARTFEIILDLTSKALCVCIIALPKSRFAVRSYIISSVHCKIVSGGMSEGSVNSIAGSHVRSPSEPCQFSTTHGERAIMADCVHAGSFGLYEYRHACRYAEACPLQSWVASHTTPFCRVPWRIRWLGDPLKILIKRLCSHSNTSQLEAGFKISQNLPLVLHATKNSARAHFPHVSVSVQDRRQTVTWRGV